MVRSPAAPFLFSGLLFGQQPLRRPGGPSRSVGIARPTSRARVTTANMVNAAKFR